MYAMQRANGDWFALDERGQLFVPVFNSSGDAMKARALNFEMLHFKPIKLDERAIDDLRPAKQGVPASFRIIIDPTLSLSRGTSMNHMELSQLGRDSTY